MIDNLKPVDVELFQEALTLLSSLHEGTVQTITDPTDRKVNIVDDEQGEVTEISFTDNPLNRFGAVMVDRFGESNRPLFMSLMMRVFAFMSITQEKAVRDTWIRDDEGDHVGIHPALVEVAASHPFDDDGGFELESYLKAVSSVAEEKYSDLT